MSPCSLLFSYPVAPLTFRPLSCLSQQHWRPSSQPLKPVRSPCSISHHRGVRIGKYPTDLLLWEWYACGCYAAWTSAWILSPSWQDFMLKGIFAVSRTSWLPLMTTRLEEGIKEDQSTRTTKRISVVNILQFLDVSFARFIRRSSSPYLCIYP